MLWQQSIGQIVLIGSSNICDDNYTLRHILYIKCGYKIIDVAVFKSEAIVYPNFS
jgi:hypothetical protein